jgi:hypothetical protein
MTPLLKWKKEQGLTYEGIITRLGGKWKRVHLVNVFNGNSTPGSLLLVSLEALTGLTIREILINFKLPGGEHE